MLALLELPLGGFVTLPPRSSSASLSSLQVKRAYMKANLIVHPDKVRQSKGSAEQVSHSPLLPSCPFPSCSLPLAPSLPCSFPPLICALLLLCLLVCRQVAIADMIFDVLKDGWGAFKP